MIEQVLAQMNIADTPATLPTGAVGVDMTDLPGTLKPSLYLVTAVVTTGVSDLYIYGAVPVGVAEDNTDDQWGFINDKYNRIVAGKLGTALAVGTHHFIVEDLGIYTRVAFKKTANSVDVYVRPIVFAG